jgi:steroid delta-isomerase-like uncharacterized protein
VTVTTRAPPGADPPLADGDPEAVARAYVALWNDRDYEAIPRLVSETFVMYDPAAPADGVPGPKGEVHGRAGLRRFVEFVTTAFPDFHITVLDMLADGDLVTYEVRLTMTHDGPLGSLPPTGRRVELPGASILRLEDGVVSDHRFYADTTDVAEQLGLTFPQVLGQLPRLLVGTLRSHR